MISKLSRRSFLKTAGTVIAAANLAGCSGSNDDGQVRNPADNLIFDNEVKTFHSTGAFNCGSRCLHKVHVKNNRVINITSAGDKKRSALADEEAEYDDAMTGKPMEMRACVRCYGGYQGILYQPDRLKYPLAIIDPNKKGDPDNYKRISWDEAITLAAGYVKEAIDYGTGKNLPYTPVLTRYFAWFSTARAVGMKPFFKICGNESFGGVDLGIWDTVGFSTYINNRTDRFNTKFMITWALDCTRTTYWNINSHFMNTKVKEGAYGTNIPMVVISTNFSDAASMLSTGVNASYTINGTPKNIRVPNWIGCRPATDGALAVAMMYVIYKNKRYDTGYLGTSAASQPASGRKCFGFYPNDEVVSMAPNDAGNKGLGKANYPFVTTKELVYGRDRYYVADAEGTTNNVPAGTPLKGITFRVPQGESFVEYLNSLEVTWGGDAIASGMDLSDGYKYPQPANTNEAGNAVYYNVLKYAASITGVHEDIIEALAMKYSEFVGTGNAAFIETGGGPQRAWNASEWVWALLALSSMCGYADKKGGGLAGMSMGHLADAAVYGKGAVPAYAHRGNPKLSARANINLESACWNHLVLTGKDHRTEQSIINDFKYQSDGATDLSGLFPLESKLIFSTNINNLSTHSNANKNIAAFKKLRHIAVDQIMTPTALHADLILPACTHFESESYAVTQSLNVPIHREKVLEPMYESKPEDMIIREILWPALNDATGLAVPSLASKIAPPFDTYGKADYDSYELTAYYKSQYPDATMPTSEELQTKGLHTIEIVKDNPLVPMRDLTKPGELDTSTGYINFYAPMRAMRPGTKRADSLLYYPGGWRNATVCYQPIIHGWESFFTNNNPTEAFTGFKSDLPADQQSGRAYTMLYMTNKSRNRGHTVFDSVSAVKDQFPQVAKMNPVEGAKRGIKEGDMVYVYNDRGCMKIPAYLSHEIIPGVVSIEHGAWYRPHPTEKIYIWMQNGSDPANPDRFHKVQVPVDVGGNDNILTNDYFGEDTMFSGGAVAAQTGPCEVSLIKPD